MFVRGLGALGVDEIIEARDGAEALRAFEAIARIDGSAGWIVSIAASSAT